MNARPRDSAPRLYVDSLNAMIDQQTVRLCGSQQPRAQRGALARAARGRGRARPARASTSRCSAGASVPIVAAAVVVSFLVLVTFDLDRPTRGLIEIPAAPLVAEKATMSLPPAAPAPPSR